MILNTKQYLGPCACGRDHELRTKLVVCEYGALERFEQYMDDCGLSGHRIVIYDTNTYNLPGMVHVKADQEIVLEAQAIEDCGSGAQENLSAMITSPASSFTTCAL